MFRLRRCRFVLSKLAIIALVLGIVAGSFVRFPPARSDAITDSVLGQLVLCHQPASDGAQPGAPDVAGQGSQDTTLGDRFNYGVAASYRIWQAPQAGGAMHLGGRFDGMMHHGGPGAHEHGGDAGHDHGGHDHGDHDHGDHDHGNGMALDVSLGLNGQWQGRQNIAGVLDDNTGGHVVSITPGLRLSVDRWAGFVNVGIPIVRDLNGIQSEPSWTLATGVALQF